MGDGELPTALADRELIERHVAGPQGAGGDTRSAAKTMSVLSSAKLDYGSIAARPGREWISRGMHERVTSISREPGRAETLRALSRIRRRPGADRVIDVTGRMSKLDEVQVSSILKMIRSVKKSAACV